MTQKEDMIKGLVAITLLMLLVMTAGIVAIAVSEFNDEDKTEEYPNSSFDTESMKLALGTKGGTIFLEGGQDVTYYKTYSSGNSYYSRIEMDHVNVNVIRITNYYTNTYYSGGTSYTVDEYRYTYLIPLDKISYISYK